MTMIAIGGSNGTGLFLATGSSIQTAGPGGAIIAYGAIGIMVYFLMTSLGEMASLMPFRDPFQHMAAVLSIRHLVLHSVGTIGQTGLLHLRLKELHRLLL